MRYAAQNMYGPSRTVEPVSGSARFLKLPTRITTLMPAEPVSITPMAAWSLQEAALSRCKGVLVRRKTQRFCILQPLHIRQRHILQTFMVPA
jgi:hypothetical protein